MTEKYEIISEKEARKIEIDSFNTTSLEIDEDLSELIEGMFSNDKPASEDKVMVPEELDADKEYVGDIYGFIRMDSGYHIIFGWEGKDFPETVGAEKIGSVGKYPELNGDYAIYGHLKEGEVSYYLVNSETQLSDDGEVIGAIRLRSDIYTMTQNLFSRNSGLIETNWLDNKCAVIAGCGSVGSLVALQLARSGVGRFVLFDMDCVEIHNVCRHQCSLSDIGRFKVDAIEERILRINPNAQVKKFYSRIQDIPVEKYSEWINSRDAIFVGCCDNHVGDAYACDYAYEFNAPFVSLLYSTRATIGEIFMALPERNDICFRCAYNTKIKEDIAEERRNHTYVGEENKDTVKFFPGLDVDIEYGVSVLDKIALDILNRFHRDYEIKIANKFRQLAFFAGTGSKSNMDEFWSTVLKEPLKIYSASVNDDCRLCEHCKKFEE